MSMLAHAYGYAKWGWRVFPVGRNKQPLTPHGFHDATTDPRILNQWWGHLLDEPNIALDIPEGTVILDFDPRNYADPEACEALFERLPETRMVATPSGGYHLYYDVPEGLTFRKQYLPGVDVKAGGRGYVLLPPSQTDPGEYRWVKGRRQVELPTWALDIIARPLVELPEGSLGTRRYFEWEEGTAYGLAVLRHKAADMAAAPEGTRNETLNRVTYIVGQFIAGGELAEAALVKIRQAAEQAGLSPEEIYPTMHSAFHAGLQTPRRAPQ
jgi:hypothetical protein